MKRLSIIIAVAAGVTMVACSDVKRERGRVYMPDMSESRAYEAYAPRDTTVFSTDMNGWDGNGNEKIHYNNMPVTGTVSRGESYVYHIPKDKQGDSVNYVASKQVVNPLAPLTATELVEAERSYLINCGICHGSKLDGNGPLYKDGTGPYPAAPKNLATLVMSDGQMFYSITYGKNMMGSYASQLTPKQRWAIIHYIRSKQAPAAPAAGTTAAAAPAADTTAKK